MINPAELDLQEENVIRVTRVAKLHRVVKISVLAL